jgi:dTDP-4-dehydrorhamnose reductase
MRILITGVSGLLGSDVWNACEQDNELIGLGRKRPGFVASSQWRDCDLTDPTKTYHTVSGCNPDAVVHCAAFSDVDKCEADPEKAYRQNTLATRNLALACQRFDSALALISTDYVFDGKDAPEGGYCEFDRTNPVSVYGQSKRDAEIIVKDLLCKFYIVRTSWLFGTGRPTYIDKVIETAEKGGKVPALSDIKSAPTYTLDLARSLSLLISSRRYGIYHVTNSGFCTREEMAQYALRKQGLTSASLHVMRQNDLKLAALRPSFSGLKNWMWSLDGFPKMRSWQEALDEYFKNRKR